MNNGNTELGLLDFLTDKGFRCESNNKILVTSPTVTYSNGERSFTWGLNEFGSRTPTLVWPRPMIGGNHYYSDEYSDLKMSEVIRSKSYDEIYHAMFHLVRFKDIQIKNK